MKGKRKGLSEIKAGAPSPFINRLLAANGAHGQQEPSENRDYRESSES